VASETHIVRRRPIRGKDIEVRYDIVKQERKTERNGLDRKGYRYVMHGMHLSKKNHGHSHKWHGFDFLSTSL
jgi:hypothetical protein